MQFMNTKEERNFLFIRILNCELQVLSVQMTPIGKMFNDVKYYVKKVKGRTSRSG